MSQQSGRHALPRADEHPLTRRELRRREREQEQRQIDRATSQVAAVSVSTQPLPVLRPATPPASAVTPVVPVTPAVRPRRIAVAPASADATPRRDTSLAAPSRRERRRRPVGRRPDAFCTWRRTLTTLGVVSAFVLANMTPGTFASADEISQSVDSSQVQTVSLSAATRSSALQRGVMTAGVARSAQAASKFSRSVLISGTPSLSQLIAAVGLPVRSQVSSIQNDYPYAGKYGGTSPFGYAYGNCTDFVAWRINRDAGVTSAPWRYQHDLTPAGGNGGQWSYAENLPGWGFGNLDTVRAGDIVSFPMSGLMGTSRVYGHVAYVAAVLSDGSLLTENYGGGKYFVEYLAASDLSQWLSSRGIVIRTHP